MNFTAGRLVLAILALLIFSYVAKRLLDAKFDRRITCTAVLCVLCTVLCGYAVIQWQMNENFLPVWNTSMKVEEEQAAGEYYTLFDKDSGEELEYMNRVVFEGDELLTGDNRHYRIHKVDGKKVHCEFIEQRNLEPVIAEIKQEVSDSQETDAVLAGTTGKDFQTIAIYCTHTDESYVPTSGTESKNGGGDILKVASTMVEELEKQSIAVIHSENIHDPHDGNAYQRSRKTASELLTEAPAAIIDVHRDGVPDAAYYETKLEGEPATQIRLVVGKKNQNSEANIAFAEKMKAYYDEVKPGLIKSIFMAKGNYNQDLAPHSILLEVGTHTNSLEQAQVGAREFAEALPQFLGLKTADASQQSNQESSMADKIDEKTTERGGFGKIIIWIIVLASAGGLGFLWLSRGSLAGRR